MAVKQVSGPTALASNAVALNFRGTWAASTAYTRGDVVVDPTTIGTGLNPTLRYASKTHTSGGSWSAGNEYGDVQWLPLPTSVPFRGAWRANVWYTPGELLIDPTTGVIVASRLSHASGATYTASNYGTPNLQVPAGLRADTLFPAVGIPDFGEHDVAGLWQRRSRLKVPQRAWLKLTPNGAEASTSGAGSLAAESDPPGPGGAVKINFPQSPVFALSGTADVTTNIFRLLTKMTGSVPPPSNGSPGTWPNTVISDVYLDVSSSGSFTDYHRIRLVHSGSDTTNVIPTGAWFWQGGGPAEWVAVGSGATLTAISHFRLSCSTPASAVTGVTMSVFGATLVPNGVRPDGLTARAKVVLYFDDDYDAAWVTAAAKMIPYGFPGTLAATIAQTAPSASSALTGAQLRHLTQAHGWQVCTHAYSQNEHNTVTDTAGFTLGGIPLRAQFMKSKHLQNIHGTNGGDDFAMFGNNAELNAEVMRAIRQNFRSARRFINNPRLVETLPPVDPHLLWGWGSAGSDAADATDKLAYVDKAIAQKGLATFTYHTMASVGAEFDALLAGLETRRAAGDIDVVTIGEALAPWTVAP